MISWIKAVRKDRYVISQLIKREVQGKYRGSKLGILWSFITPVIMLCVYTVIFAGVFKAKWGTEIEGVNTTINYAFNLFTGLTVFSIFSEAIARAPTLIISNPNYVKKIKFPLHSLGIMTVGGSLYQAAGSICIVITAKFLATGNLDTTIVLIPLIWGSLAITCLALVWLVASTAVYIRDITQVISPLISMFMFMSPIFYPTEALPEYMRWVSLLNPVAHTIEDTRLVLLQGEVPSLTAMSVQWITALIFCEASYKALKRMELGFGDKL